MRASIGSGKQQGSSLIEALVSMVVLGVGMLAYIALQATAIGNAADAKYRADAALFANQILGLMRSDIANLAQYAHNPNGGEIAANCAPTASPSINPGVQLWTRDVADALPGAAAERHQIVVDPNGRVVIRICWQSPQDPGPRNIIVGGVVQ